MRRDEILRKQSEADQRKFDAWAKAEGYGVEDRTGGTRWLSIDGEHVAIVNIWHYTGYYGGDRRPYRLNARTLPQRGRQYKWSSWKHGTTRSYVSMDSLKAAVKKFATATSDEEHALNSLKERRSSLRRDFEKVLRAVEMKEDSIKEVLFQEFLGNGARDAGWDEQQKDEYWALQHQLAVLKKNRDYIEKQIENFKGEDTCQEN